MERLAQGEKHLEAGRAIAYQTPLSSARDVQHLGLHVVALAFAGGIK